MRKNWILKNDDDKKISELAKKIGVNELTAKILIHRGITDEKSAEKFLNPEAQDFYDPFLMLGMSDAVERIAVAIEGGEKICIFGDYDVDGMSATAILFRALRRFDAQVTAYIPKRTEGYGMNIPALKKIASNGVTLLISVDCGISNAKEISEIKNDLDVIVTDHHLPALEKVTDAVAILDPNQKGCNYPAKNLCGAGVAFKLCQALNAELNNTNFLNYTTDIDIAAMATVADLVPLTDENRKIVKLGLKNMSDSNCIGLNALVKISGLAEKNISSTDIAFKIAPRLNSIGRLKVPSTGLKLLLTNDEFEAENIAKMLDDANNERKEIEKNIFIEAENTMQIFRDEKGGDLWSLVIAGENWNPGIVGLTASKIVEKYSLPTLIVSADKIVSRGSCRSIPALHIKNALDSMSDLFENYGGHSQAAGFSIPTKKIPELRQRFDEYVRKNLTDRDFSQNIEIDAIINPTEISMKTAEELEKFQPCGLGNPEPVLACKNIQCSNAKVIGDGTHLSFEIPAEKKIKAVAFGKANFVSLINSEPVDFIYRIEIEQWQGEQHLKCFVTDIEPAAEKTSITRQQLGEIYKLLKIIHQSNNKFDMYLIAQKFQDSGKKFSMSVILDAIDIFSELGLLVVDAVNKTFDLPSGKKRSLENSRTFRILNKV